MTFEQEIATIDELARSCRSREQANVMLETEVQTLRADNIRLNTALEHRQEHLDALDEKTLKTTAKLEMRYATTVNSKLPSSNC
jgi:hypothetical protein